MKTRICAFIFCLLASCAVISSFAKQERGTLIVRVIPVFNGAPLLLENKNYITANGDSVSIEIFKFYLSNLQLSDGGRNSFKPGEHYLINAEDSSSLSFVWKDVPATKYTALNLSIGADSLANVSGALDGALDPVNGMYWAWNTGYINAKLTGHSPQCKTLHNAFEFHIGGYLKPFNTLQKVIIPLNKFEIKTGENNVLTIYADVAKWFEGPVKIDVSKTNSIVMPDKNAMLMAGNYADMFYVGK